MGGCAEDQPVGDTAIDRVIPSSAAGTAAAPVATPDAGTDLLDLSDQAGTTAVASNAAQAQETQQAPGGNLLDLVDLAPVETTTAQPAASANLLEEVLGGGVTSTAPAVVQDSQLLTTAPIPHVAEPIMMEVFDKGGLKVTFACRKDVATGSLGVLATFTNSTAAPITSFVFEVAVPKYMKLQMEAASSQVLQPMSNDVSQNMTLVNTMQGERPVMMKLRISYDQNGVVVQETAQVSNFPQGF